MPLFEMSMSELKKFMGRNPCPPDLDRFWDKNLAKDMVLYPDFGHEGLPGMSDKVFEFMRRL
jgi:cephalosporin-C deacetylase-like acetyl esterase